MAPLAPGPRDPGPLRTVLVDDVAEMRELVRALLRRDGRFSIVGEAANGLDALEVVADLRPDLVVLDIDMPVLDGLATVPRIRELSPETRIVMLSGYAVDEMEPPSLAAGAVGYVRKGADIASLPSQLHALASLLVTAALVGTSVRVSVSDDVAGMRPTDPQADADHDGGRGLAIVARLATSWGVDAGDLGKTVWFELEL